MALMYLSLGSNMGDRLANLKKAIERIEATQGFSVTGVGGYYETEPQGDMDQPWFVNTAVAVRTDMNPHEALRLLLEIEAGMGRSRKDRAGPRPIDVDMIFYDNLVLEDAELVLPHPRSAERRFVLAPIADIDPGAVHPVEGKSVSSLLASLSGEGQAMRKIKD